MLKIPWNCSCCHVVISCRNPFQLCWWCCTLFNIVCRRLGIYHCSLCPSAISSQVFFFFLLHAVIVSFIHGSFGLSDTFLMPRDVNFSISWFRDILYNSTKSSSELQSPWYGTSMRTSLFRRLMLIAFVFPYDTCFIFFWFWMVFEVWNGWGYDLIFVIVFLFLWWC